MIQRTPPASKSDDRTFAVRVRIAIPEEAEERFRLMKAKDDWLLAQGRQHYAVHPASHYPRDTCYLYFHDLETAIRCVQEVGLTIDAKPKETP